MTAKDFQQTPTESPEAHPHSRDRLLANPFWAIVILSGVSFVVTCLMSVAAMMGDPKGPMNRLVSSYGTQAVTVQASVLILAGLLAMTVDRIQTRRQTRRLPPSEPQPSLGAPDRGTGS
ncbi:MAG: hypothetical protein KF861_01480 [Planctomycetaceae bacterium]|nr:hypothetical protein [Planctomycetaceae bacterium]